MELGIPRNVAENLKIRCFLWKYNLRLAWQRMTLKAVSVATASYELCQIIYKSIFFLSSLQTERLKDFKNIYIYFKFLNACARFQGGKNLDKAEFQCPKLF